MKEAAYFAPYMLAGSCLVFSAATYVVGLSVWLVPAVVLPLAEFLIRFRYPIKFFGPVLPTLSILSIHSLLLSLVQYGTIGEVRLAANFQYMSLLVGALGLGAYLFRADILSEEED